MPSSVERMRAQLGRLRTALVLPEPFPEPLNVMRELQGTGEAVASLCQAGSESHSRSELLALHSELRRTSRLIQSGAEFWAGLSTSSTGYTLGGAAGSFQPPPHIVEQG